jgi:hypothetical protein
MSNLNQIIELLQTISQKGEDSIDLDKVIDLLKNISKSKRHVKIELNYDGKEWYSNVILPNITAIEWLMGERILKNKSIDTR